MRLSPFIALVGLALPLGGACGSVLTTNDGGGGSGGGTGGHGGAAGGGNSGGSGGTGGVSCGDLATQYTDALPAAQSCDVKASGECQQLVSSSLSPCFVTCMTYVNDSTALNAIKASWEQAGCNNVAVLCPAIACLQPTNNMCLVGDAGSGVCSSNRGSGGAGAGGHAGGEAGGGGSGGSSGGAGSGGTLGSGGNQGTDGGMTCSPGCTSGSICIASGTEGGAIINANDAGVCPAGTHPTGFENRCENNLAYGCMQIPATCGGTVTCTCAATLCRAPEICMGPTNGVLSCILEAP